MDESERMTVAELTARIDAGWAALQRVLERFDEAALARRDPATGWSITDHLAHLAAWEGGIAALLRRESRAEGMGITEAEWRDLTMDQINDVIVARNATRTPAEARARFAEVHADLLAAIRGLSDDDLLKGYSTFAPEEAEHDTGAPVVGWIIGNTYEHYAEHVGWFEAWPAS